MTCSLRWTNCRSRPTESANNWWWFRAPGCAKVSEPFPLEDTDMKRNVFLPMLALGILGFGLALRAGAPKTETVSYKSGDETVSGYLALPDGAGKHPAVIVIHEWWGLNDWVKEQAQKYAAQGYVALAVYLYRGKVATNQDEAHVLMRGLPDDRGMRDLEAAFTYLSS